MPVRLRRPGEKPIRPTRRGPVILGAILATDWDNGVVRTRFAAGRKITERWVPYRRVRGV